VFAARGWSPDASATSSNRDDPASRDKQVACFPRMSASQRPATLTAASVEKQSVSKLVVLPAGYVQLVGQAC
jgi:hypothetical protein